MGSRLRESMKKTLKSLAKNEQLKLIAEGKVLQQEMTDDYNYNILQKKPELLDRKIAREAEYKAKRQVMEDQALEDYLAKNPDMLDKIVEAELLKDKRTKSMKDKKDKIVADGRAAQERANANRADDPFVLARAAPAVAPPPRRDEAGAAAALAARTGTIPTLAQAQVQAADALLQREQAAAVIAAAQDAVAVSNARELRKAFDEAESLRAAVPVDAPTTASAVRGRPQTRGDAPLSPRGKSVAPSSRIPIEYVKKEKPTDADLEVFKAQLIAAADARFAKDQAAKSTTAAATVHLTKDGKPDMRYSENKRKL